MAENKSRKAGQRMNLFHMKSDFNGTSRISEFLQENFVSFSGSGIVSSENVSQEMMTFVYAMQDGDYVLIADEHDAYLGDLGDYYYIDDSAAISESMCHRRGVTWLKRTPREGLTEELQRFLNHQGAIAKFDRAVTMEQMERWLSADADCEQNAGQRMEVDAQTVEEALEILKAAMRSEDIERRERAAIAILQYSK